MENLTLSPTMSAKLKSRELAKKMKCGSPKLQEVLRERCRLKMREKRGQLFNSSRFGLEIESENIRTTLSQIIRKELKTIATTDNDPTVNPFFRFNSEPIGLEDAFELENEIVKEEGSDEKVEARESKKTVEEIEEPKTTERYN
ncbi:uncharacterized protein LOC144474532 isoform X2 [Augochlora pura]